MKKVLIVNHFSDDIGGCESFFNKLARLFNTRVVGLKEAYDTGIKPANIEYYRNAHIDRSLYLVKYIKKYMESFDLDLVICNDDIASHFWRLGVPYISVFQNPYTDISEFLHKNGLYDLNTYDEFNYSYSLAQFIAGKNSILNVAVSKYMQDYVQKLGCDAKIIEHGVDTSYWMPVTPEIKQALRIKYDIPQDKKVGIIVAKFHPLKYHFVPSLVHKFQDVFWIIILGNYQTIPYTPYSKNVKVVWRANRDTMLELYQASDFYCLPSVYESFNLSAIEAASCDLPVVVTKTGYFTDKDFSDMGVGCDREVKSYYSGVERILNEKFEPRKSIFRNDLTIERFNREWSDLVYGLELKKV